MDQNAEFTLRDALLLIKKRFLLIFLLSVSFAIAGYLGSKYLIVPKYESSATLIVSINPDKESDYNDVTFSQKLVDIYSVILKNQTLLNQVVQELDIPVNPGALANNITISNVESTGILIISVQDTDPVRAKAVADKIVELAPGEINRTVKAGSVEVISPAQSAQYISPNNRKNAVIGMFSGFLLSLVITFLLELLNHKFKTGEDVKKKIGYSVLGTIPYSGQIKELSNSNPAESAKKVPFQIYESFHTVLTNLKYAAIDKPVKKIIVTSSVPGEGKSAIALNLALSFAQLGKKVLFVDMDLRKSNSQKNYKAKNAKFKGVSSLLTNSCSLSEAIVHNRDWGIDILPSGPIPPNPIVLLQSNAMKNMFTQLDTTYDYILIDTPPVSVFSDAMTLLPLTDGVIFVVRQNYTTFESAISTKNQLENVKANILGCILNSYRYKNSDKLYAYYHKYQNHR